MVYFLSHLKNLLVKVWDILEFLNFILQSHAFLKLHLNYAKFREVSHIVCTMLLISCPSACDDATRSLSPCEFPILRLFPFFLHCSLHHFFSRYSSHFASFLCHSFRLFLRSFKEINDNERRVVMIFSLFENYLCHFLGLWRSPSFIIFYIDLVYLFIVHSK